MTERAAIEWVLLAVVLYGFAATLVALRYWIALNEVRPMLEKAISDLETMIKSAEE